MSGGAGYLQVHRNRPTLCPKQPNVIPMDYEFGRIVPELRVNLTAFTNMLGYDSEGAKKRINEL